MNAHQKSITVLGQDRPGIIAETTAALADLGLNLEDSTMTLLRGQFAMMLLCHGAPSVPEIERALEGLAADGTLAVAVREVSASHRHTSPASSYTLSVHGGDRPGIVSAVVADVAAAGGNITDLATRWSQALYVLVAEVDVPLAGDVDALRERLSATAQTLGVTVTFRKAESDEL